MKTLLSFILLNMTQQNLPAKIHSITADYLQECGSTSVALLTNNPNNWNVQFNIPLIIRQLDDTTPQNLPTMVFILDLRNQALSAKHIKPLNRHASTRYILITSIENLKPTSKAVLEIGLCHVLLLTIAFNDVTISHPYDPCKGIGTDVTTGHKCSENISFLTFEPWEMFSDGVLKGSEGTTVQTIADSMDIKLSYINRGEFWGHFEPPTGLEGDISSGTSLMGIGALYWFWWRLKHADIINGCSTMDVRFAVPVGAGKMQPTWFTIIVTELQPLVWLCVLLTYLIAIAASAFIERNPQYTDYWAFHNLALLLGNPQKMIQRKSLTLSVIMYGFLLTTYYKTIMSSKLTAPAQVPELTTWKELAESKLELTGPTNPNKLIRASSATLDNPYLKLINASLKNVNTTLIDALLEIATERNKAYFGHGSIYYYTAQKDSRTLNRIHMLEEKFDLYFPIILVRKHSCLYHQLHKRYNRLCDCGLIRKWENDVAGKKRVTKDNGPKKLTLDHIKGFFIILAIGWSAGLIAFMGENFYYAFPKKEE